MKNVINYADLSSGVYWWRLGSYAYSSRQRLRGKYAISEVSWPVLDPHVMTATSAINVCTRYDNFLPAYFADLKSSFPQCKINVWYDDLIDYEQIPRYNNGREYYRYKHDQVAAIISAADRLIVTTSYLKERMVEAFGAPAEKVVCLPNLLPEAWLQPVMRGYRVESHRAVRNGTRKPRIGVCATGNHINTRGVYELPDGTLCRRGDDGRWETLDGKAVDDMAERTWVPDDMSVIEPLVRETCDRWEWVFVGTPPASMADLVAQKRVEFRPGSPIGTWLPYINSLRLDAFVAPLLDNKFNRSKSPIKALEAHALGLPIFVSDIGVYDGVVADGDFRFCDHADLKAKLEAYWTRSEKYVETTIGRDMDGLFEPFVLDGRRYNGWLLEPNAAVLDDVILGQY